MALYGERHKKSSHRHLGTLSSQLGTRNTRHLGNSLSGGFLLFPRDGEADDESYEGEE